jgi:pyruvate/2-oxoacid:ferredoxin oxidoreductase alpha subunit
MSRWIDQMGERLARLRKVVSGNEAASLAVKLARVQVISAYPITPQTTISEKLSEICGSGELEARFVKVESEHSAMATLVGAASTGARTFTATSAQGLALMQELLFWASGARLPIVLVDVNRAMAAPWTIWCDQTDSVAQRDTGWIQLYCSSAQEVLDSTICAFKIAEELLLPCMICFDGFFISHTLEPVDVPDQDDVDAFLPPRKAEYFLDTNDPRTFSGGTLPSDFMEFRYKVQKAFEKSVSVIDSVFDEYAAQFGRQYRSVEPHFLEDADVVLVVTGSAASTAFHAARELRKEGKKLGLLRLRQLRPFPEKEFLSHLRTNMRIGVLDRNLSPGTGGVFTQEVRSVLSRHTYQNPVHEFVAGLGGRDITSDNIGEIYETLNSATVFDPQINWIGLKK